MSNFSYNIAIIVLFSARLNFECLSRNVPLKILLHGQDHPEDYTALTHYMRKIDISTRRLG